MEQMDMHGNPRIDEGVFSTNVAVDVMPEEKMDEDFEPNKSHINASDLKTAYKEDINKNIAHDTKKPSLEDYDQINIDHKTM